MHIEKNIIDAWLDYLSKEFEVSLSAQQTEQFMLLLNELDEWNQKFNLVSFKTPDEILWRHFADSIAAAKSIKSHCGGAGTAGMAADIGAGAGFPGLPLKIVFPEMKLTLIESIGKKCSFMRHIVDKLGLKDTIVFNGRAELLGQDNETREKYDITLSRAVSAFSPNLEAALPLLKIGGFSFIHKYENYGEELASANAALEILGGRFEEAFEYKLPGSIRDSFVIAVSKVSSTPTKYPRRPGMSEKKPL